MAGGQVHILNVGHVPSVDDDAAAVGVVFYGLDDLAYLVDVSALVVGPRAPLIAVYVSEVAIFVGPLVPYSDTIFLQVFYVGVAVEEPQKLVDYGF